MTKQIAIGLVAGNGVFPEYIIQGARKYDPGTRVIVVGFKGETSPHIAGLADEYAEFHVGQIIKPFAFLKKHGAKNIIMAGGLNPSNIFNIRPDRRTLMALFKLKRRNADTLFGAVVQMAEEDDLFIMPSFTYMDDHIAPLGHLYGPAPTDAQVSDAALGAHTSRTAAKLNVGQVCAVHDGKVIAIEGVEGSNECLKRAGRLCPSGGITMTKMAQFNHDVRFDLPCVGPQTLLSAIDAGISQIVVEAGKTILLQKEQIAELCKQHAISFSAL